MPGGEVVTTPTIDPAQPAEARPLTLRVVAQGLTVLLLVAPLEHEPVEDVVDADVIDDVSVDQTDELVEELAGGAPSCVDPVDPPGEQSWPPARGVAVVIYRPAGGYRGRRRRTPGLLARLFRAGRPPDTGR